MNRAEKNELVAKELLRIATQLKEIKKVSPKAFEAIMKVVYMD